MVGTDGLTPTDRSFLMICSHTTESSVATRTPDRAHEDLTRHGVHKRDGSTQHVSPGSRRASL
jgi:hypothetical protein